MMHSIHSSQLKTLAEESLKSVIMACPPKPLFQMSLSGQELVCYVKGEGRTLNLQLLTRSSFCGTANFITLANTC